MAKKRFIVEFGTGIDLHGEDVTKAACRAVEGGMMAQGLCVAQFGPECDQVVVANAAVTVSVKQ